MEEKLCDHDMNLGTLDIQPDVPQQPSDDYAIKFRYGHNHDVTVMRHVNGKSGTRRR